MSNVRPPADAHARSLAALPTRVLASGVLVLAGTVCLAVWGPALHLPGMRDDARSWAAGATLLGGLLLLTLQGLLLRPLGRLQRRAAQTLADCAELQAALLSLTQQQAIAEHQLASARNQLRAVAEASAQRPVPAAAGSRDALTGLLSAPAFQGRLEHWLQHAGPAQAAALLIIDLDRFKHINDTAGTAAGDTVLRQAAAVLQAHVRAGDVVARLEGDTYAMLLPGCVAEVAVQMGERLRHALSALGADHAGRRLGVGATVGVAEREGNLAATAWMARAQAAWYEAKYAGRGAVRLAARASEVALVVPA